MLWGQEPLEWDTKDCSLISVYIPDVNVGWEGTLCLVKAGSHDHTFTFSVVMPLSLFRLHCHVEPWRWETGLPQFRMNHWKGICFPLFLLVLLSWVFTAVIRFNTRNFPLVSDNLISLKGAIQLGITPHCRKPEYQTRRDVLMQDYTWWRVSSSRYSGCNVQKECLGNVTFISTLGHLEFIPNLGMHQSLAWY